jgi:hypothetical protein
MTQYQDVTTTKNEEGSGQRVATFKVTQLIWLLIGVLEALIALRVVFKLIAVNPTNPFAAFLYTITGFFVAPFTSLLGSPASGGMVLEISSILAMIVYFLVAWAVERVVYLVLYNPRGPVSIRQTTVAEQTPPQIPVTARQTTVTHRPDTLTPKNE